MIRFLETGTKRRGVEGGCDGIRWAKGHTRGNCGTNGGSEEGHGGLFD